MTNDDGTADSTRLSRRGTLRGGAIALGSAVVTGGAFVYSSQPAMASDGIEASASVVLDENEQTVTEANVQPTVTLDWDDVSNGIDDFDLELAITADPGLDEDGLDELLEDGVAAETVVESWNNIHDGTAEETLTIDNFDDDTPENIDRVEATDGDLDAASGTLEIETELLEFLEDGTPNFDQNEDEPKFPAEIGDDEAAGTRIEIDAEATVRDDAGESTVYTVDFESIEFAIAIDNPAGTTDSDGVEADADADGE